MPARGWESGCGARTAPVTHTDAIGDIPLSCSGSASRGDSHNTAVRRMRSTQRCWSLMCMQRTSLGETTDGCRQSTRHLTCGCDGSVTCWDGTLLPRPRQWRSRSRFTGYALAVAILCGSARTPAGMPRVVSYCSHAWLTIITGTNCNVNVQSRLFANSSHLIRCGLRES